MNIRLCHLVALIFRLPAVNGNEKISYYNYYRSYYYYLLGLENVMRQNIFGIWNGAFTPSYFARRQLKFSQISTCILLVPLSNPSVN